MGAHRHPQPNEAVGEPDGIGRRRFLGYVVAASTLTVAAQLGEGIFATAADAVVPSVPGPAEIYDLNDMLTHATLPTANLITIRVDADGTASFALPRAEVGQGITTSSAMLIAEELDLPLERIRVSLADARPELVFNQLTPAGPTRRSPPSPRSGWRPPSPAAGY